MSGYIYPPPAAQATYSFNVNANLSSQIGVWTIQQPASPTKSAILSSIYVASPAAPCVFTVERDGSQATLTAANIVDQNPASPTSTLLSFLQSNSVGGVVLGTYGLGAGGSIFVPVEGLVLWNFQGGRNLTIRTASMTGQVLVNFKWYEQ